MSRGDVGIAHTPAGQLASIAARVNVIAFDLCETGGPAKVIGLSPVSKRPAEVGSTGMPQTGSVASCSRRQPRPDLKQGRLDYWIVHLKFIPRIAIVLFDANQ